MPTRIANVSLTIHREGKRISVKPGEKFNFTATEIEDLAKLNASALRLPVNEGGIDDENVVPTNPNLVGSNLQPGGNMSGITGGGTTGGGTTDDNVDDKVDLDSLKVDQLRDYAKKHELEVDLSLNKEPLLAAIKAAVADESDL